MNERVVKNPNFKNNREFHTTLKTRGVGAKDYPNSHTEVEHLGNGKFAASISVGHRVFFDKGDGNKPKKHKLTDARPSKDYVLVQGARCCVEVYPYYAKYFDVQHEEVRLYEERWVVQRLFKEPDTWRDVDAYNPQMTVEEYSELAGDVVKVTVTYDTDYGTLIVEYFQRDGNALKHNITFQNTSGSTETFRVLQRWAGIVADEINGGLINEPMSVRTKDFRFSKAGHLCVRENLSSFNPPLNPPPPSLAGETLYCLNNQLTDAHDIVASYENIKPMTLLLTETPRHVFLGREADINANVNTDYCEEQNIPVIRSNFLGRGYAYDEGSALYVALSCPSSAPEHLLQTILSRAVNSLGISTSISDNDIRCGDGRVGMTAPPLENTYTVLGELVLRSDFDMVEGALCFPDDKWEGKPTNNIREWIKPLSTLASIDMATLKEAVVQAAQDVLGVQIKWSTDGSDIPSARYPFDLYQTRIDPHPQGLKADFTYGNWALAQDERLEIDPDTSTDDDPTVDGYTTDTSKVDDGAEIVFGMYNLKTLWAWRGYVEWDISGLAGATVTKVEFRYEGSIHHASATNSDIRGIGVQPSVTAAAALFAAIAAGDAYLLNDAVFPEVGATKDVGGASGPAWDTDPCTDLETAIGNGWWAFGFKTQETEDPDGAGSWAHRIYAEEKTEPAPTPKPTLYVEYTPAYSPATRSANMGSKMVAAGLI